MEYRSIGSLTVSFVGLGCNNFGSRIDADATAMVVGSALEAGITLFDTADIYGAGLGERLLGGALGSHRDEVVIATKFGLGDGTSLPAGAGARAIARAVEGSLERLGTDRIDLFQLHMPDASVPIAETLQALQELVAQGKVREIGCSNFDAAQLSTAADAAEPLGTSRFVCVENEMNLLHRKGEGDLFDACERHDIQVIPFYPLANGLLTGKYSADLEPPKGTRLASMPEERRAGLLSASNMDLVRSLTDFATSRGHTLLELAMSWLTGHTRIASVIAGATRPEQVQANVDSANWILTNDEREEIDSLSPPG